jgi:aspartate/methionine/tyrosine aminotransferase
MDLLARAQQLEAEGRSVIHLEVGEPDFATAHPIIDAGITALQNRSTHYTPASGLPELKQKLSDYYRQHFQLDIDPYRIVITPGASGALQLVLAALLDVDDEVMVSDPGYPCNRNIAQVLASKARAVPVDAGTAYQLNATMVDDYWSSKTRAVMVASPSNPTGTSVTPQQLRELHACVSAHHGGLIVDEIYQGLVYNNEKYSALQLAEECAADNIVVINSFSKYCGMTGWRVGWAVLPEHLVDSVDRMAQNLFLAPATISQHAALRALDDDCMEIFDARVQTFRQRRDYLLKALRDIGFIIETEPQGAFYIYANCSQFTQDSFSWVQGLLEAEGVAITPGIDFGDYRANEYVRFAYTRPVEQLESAVQRIIKYINNTK